MKATVDSHFSLQGKATQTMTHFESHNCICSFLWGGLLAHSQDVMKTQHLQHNRKLTLRMKTAFLKRNYLLQKTAITNLSCESSRRNIVLLSDVVHHFQQLILISYIRSCTLAYRLQKSFLVGLLIELFISIT